MDRDDGACHGLLLHELVDESSCSRAWQSRQGLARSAEARGSAREPDGRHARTPILGQLNKRKLVTSADLQELLNGRIVRYCGLVTLRLQPETANGLIFVSLEDETGVAQGIHWKRIRE